MNLEELQAARDRERQTDKLQQLRESFYADAGEFIQQLQTERDRAAERADDPFDSPEVSQLTDEINTAEQTVEAIYEKRVGKIVKAASFAAADLPAEAEGMTKEEQDLFDTLVENIKANRQHVLAVLDGEEPPTDETAGTTAPEPDVSAADLMGTGDETAADSEPPAEISAPTEPPADADPEPPAERPPTGGDQPPTEQGADREMPPQESDHVGERAPDTADPGHPEAPTHQGDAVRNDGGKPATAASTEGTSPGTDSEPPAIQRQTVRITDDVGTFVGSDERDYDLERDDIVTLPESNASILIDRDAAEQL
ncbi:DNA replication complex subunit Gins51 [Halovenus sp. HT40]|uniref:DNA replication complex subunit Gins51 n=1 Tax=Halovenus sp. HT40 TaxID=3126691 RepID=UPI00300F2417